MPSFQYQSLTQGGDRRTGVLTAASRAEAVRMLLTRGETATRVQPMDGPDEKTESSTRNRWNGARAPLLDPSSAVRPAWRAWTAMPQRAIRGACSPDLISDSAGMPSSRCNRQIILRLSDRLRFNTS